jgi:prevent-host-death family protein
MRTVNISELKARLCAHIQHVKDGEELLVCDRNKPVARIIPCSTVDRSAREQRLIARGVLVPAKKKQRSPLPPPAGSVSDEVMERIWREERENR